MFENMFAVPWHDKVVVGTTDIVRPTPEEEPRPLKEEIDFILGTDPDSDRVGIMVRNKQGEFEPVTGNQTGVLLLDYLIGAMKRAGKLPANAAALKTIVTTEMARAVAEANGLDCYDTIPPRWISWKGCTCLIPTRGSLRKRIGTCPKTGKKSSIRP